jgi:NAD(P)H-flavin reductase
MTEALADPMIPAPWTIRRVRRETHDTCTLALELATEQGQLPFGAGQFNMLYVFGVGEVPISLSGNPATPETLTHTVRAVGAVTQAIHRLKRGDVIGVRGPFGSSWPLAEAIGSDVVLAAGGIGLAPLRPALYHVLAQREKYGRVVLLYGARTPRDLLFRRELEQWRSRFDLEVEITLDTASKDWRGNVGVVTRLITAAPFDSQNAVAMICGPEIMMRFTVLELKRRGMSDEKIYLSMERNMKCAIGFCGHCQFGPTFICKDGPVFRYDRIREWLAIREV